MKKYTISQVNKGYTITDQLEKGLTFSEIYAFSTLEEALAFFPTLFKPKEPVKQEATEAVTALNTIDDFVSSLRYLLKSLIN